MVVSGGLLLFTAWFLVANIRSASQELAMDVDAPPPLARAGTLDVSGGVDGPLPPLATRAQVTAVAASVAVPHPAPSAPAPQAPAPVAPVPVVPVAVAPAAAAVPSPDPEVRATQRISPGRPARLASSGVHGAQGGFDLELRFDAPVLLHTTYKEGPRLLELTLFPVEREGLAERLPPVSFIESVTDVGRGRKAVLRVQVAPDFSPQPPLPAGEGEVFHLRFQKGQRRPGLPPGAQLNQLAESPVVPGLREVRYRYKPADHEGSDVIVLEVDPRSPEIELAVAYGEDRILGKERVSSMARKAGALAAVNASFFSKNGDPLGLLAEEGKILSMPLMARGVLGVFEGGDKVLIGNPGFSGRVDFDGGSVRVDGVNQTRKAGKVILYTPEWGERTGTPGGGIEVAVRGSQVVSMADGNLEIPPDGFVIAVQGGEAAQALAGIGSEGTVRVVAGMTPPWDRADFAVGGGPVLVRSGRPRVEWREESFSRSLVVAQAPRTAVGVRPEGTMVLVAVDGRRPGTNRGVDLYELADLMVELGCVEALNLDGGGSTALVRDGRVQNRPSDGSERQVSTAILVLPKRQPAAHAAPLYAGVEAELPFASL